MAWLGLAIALHLLHIQHIPVKLKYLLPLLQMVLAIGLLRLSNSWVKAMRGVEDIPGPSPAFNLLVCINAPVGAARAFWFRYLPGYWVDLTFIVAIGLFWYWIALNINSWRERRMVVMFTWWPMRIAGDLLLIGVGAILLVYVYVNQFGVRMAVEALRGPLSPGQLAWRWLVPNIGLPLVWSLALIFFFGRDFVHCVLRKKTRISSVAPG